MNYYRHHIGDYAQATGHLSFVEDAAYSRMIRKYYADERPLPADLKAVQRLVGARTKDEREAVKTVLEEFFSLEQDGWHQRRCDEELAVAHAKAERNREIGKLGGRPKRETQTVTENNPDGSDSETQMVPKNNPSHKPIANSHKPTTKGLKTKAPAAPVLLPDWLPEDAWGSFVEFRGKIKAPMTDVAAKLAIAELEKLMQDGHRPRAVLEQSILNGWKGVFPLKAQARANGGHETREAFNARENARAKELLFGPETNDVA